MLRPSPKFLTLNRLLISLSLIQATMLVCLIPQMYVSQSDADLLSEGCKDWGSFWLNEGWTTYCERLLIRATQGEAERGFAYIIGYKALLGSLKGYEEGEKKYQRLVIPFEYGEDPDGET